MASLEQQLAAAHEHASRQAAEVASLQHQLQHLWGVQTAAAAQAGEQAAAVAALQQQLAAAAAAESKREQAEQESAAHARRLMCEQAEQLQQQMEALHLRERMWEGERKSL